MQKKIRCNYSLL